MAAAVVPSFVLMFVANLGLPDREMVRTGVRT